jgi:hypothetical protein
MTRVQFPAGAMMGIFVSTTASILLLGLTQPSIQSVEGILLPRVKRPRYEADPSPPSSAEVKNAWSYTSLVKHSDNFTFILPNLYGENKLTIVQNRSNSVQFSVVVQVPTTLNLLYRKLNYRTASASAIVTTQNIHTEFVAHL